MTRPVTAQFSRSCPKPQTGGLFRVSSRPRGRSFSRGCCLVAWWTGHSSSSSSRHHQSALPIGAVPTSKCRLPSSARCGLLPCGWGHARENWAHHAHLDGDRRLARRADGRPPALEFGPSPHAGIGYVTPSDAHEGRGPTIRKAREVGLEAARLQRIAYHRDRHEQHRERGPTTMSFDRTGICVAKSAAGDPGLGGREVERLGVGMESSSRQVIAQGVDDEVEVVVAERSGCSGGGQVGANH